MHIKHLKKHTKQVKSKLSYHYPFSIIVALVIWVVCMIPIPETPLDNVRFIDKWTHFAMYGTFTTVIWVEYALHHTSISWRRLLIGGALLPALMGGAVELAQAYLTTYRSGEWLDALCNSLGVLLGVVIGRLFIYIKNR